MTNDALEELGRKMDALGLWELMMPFNYVVMPARSFRISAPCSAATAIRSRSGSS